MDTIRGFDGDGEFICPITGEIHKLGEPQRVLLGVDKTFSIGTSSNGGFLVWRLGEKQGFIPVPPNQLWTIDFAIACRKAIYEITGHKAEEE